MEKQLDVIIDEFKQSKGKYEFFDVNFWLTATALRTFYPITNVEMLVSEMKKHAIEKACLLYTSERRYVGNWLLPVQTSLLIIIVPPGLPKGLKRNF